MNAAAAYAVSEANSRGRAHAEPAPGIRSEFQRDRDRIVHSTAFRRLEYKTQVFVNHEGDLFRTRLTHSIEVAQITRSIARALRLNEDLAEAIALAHDLGHTPFGHAGQDALHDCMREHGGFEHNLQSLRGVVGPHEHMFGAILPDQPFQQGGIEHCRVEPEVPEILGGQSVDVFAHLRSVTEGMVGPCAVEGEIASTVYDNHP
jgi:dGTPase